MKKPIVIDFSDDGQFYYYVNAPNGELLVHCETHEQKPSTIKNIRALAKIFKKIAESSDPLDCFIDDRTIIKK